MTSNEIIFLSKIFDRIFWRLHCLSSETTYPQDRAFLLDELDKFQQAIDSPEIENQRWNEK